MFAQGHNRTTHLLFYPYCSSSTGVCPPGFTRRPDQLLDQSAGYELRFRVSARVDAAAPPEVRAALDRLLAKVSATLRTAPK